MKLVTAHLIITLVIASGSEATQAFQRCFQASVILISPEKPGLLRSRSQ